MSRKAYYNTGASLMRSHARQYKDAEDRVAETKEYVDNVIPRNYAAFMLVLHRHFGFTQEQLEEVLGYTQELYNESYVNGLSIFDECSEETGLDIRGEIYAKKHRIVGDLRI